MASNIISIYNNIDKTLEADPSILNKLHSELSKIVSYAYTQSMASDEGFCFKFTLPITPVQNLFTLLKLDPTATAKSFQEDWKYPSHANMYNDSYYHILLLLAYYGLKKNDQQLVNNALFILLQKLWNGRKYHYIKYCDKRVMNYVVNHLVSKKHMVSKYDSPLLLLRDYFVPTLLKKYGPEILRDPIRLKQLFMQSWARIDQMFAFNPRIDIETGLKRAQGGLLPLYMKAREEGLYLSSPTIMKSGEEGEETGFDEYSTLHNRDAIITGTADFITMNTKPHYSTDFVNEVNSYTKVSSKVINGMLTAMHNHKYYDLIHDTIGVILSRTNIVDKNDICKKEFMINVKRSIISSKNTEEVKKIQTLLFGISERVFEDINLDIKRYGRAQQMQICNVILYGLVYNLKKVNCQGTVEV